MASKTDNSKQGATSAASNSYFPATLFNVAKFEDFDDEDFVEKLTYRLLNEAKKAETGALAADFQQLFDKSLLQLEDLLSEVNSNTEGVIQEMQESERNYKQKVQELNVFMDKISDNFRVIEDSINKVGNTTVQIGNRLEMVDKQKKRALEAKKLIRYFNGFNKYDPAQFKRLLSAANPPANFLNPIFTDPQRRHEAAKKLQKLNAIIKDLEKVPGCSNGVLNVQKYSENLEQILSRSFSRAVKRLDKTRMRVIAKILFDLNGGASCVAAYNNIRYFSFLGFDDENNGNDGDGDDDDFDEENDIQLYTESIIHIDNPLQSQDDEDDDDEEDDDEATAAENVNSTATNQSQSTSRHSNHGKERARDRDEDDEDGSRGGHSSDEEHRTGGGGGHQSSDDDEGHVSDNSGVRERERDADSSFEERRPPKQQAKQKRKRVRNYAEKENQKSITDVKTVDELCDIFIKIENMCTEDYRVMRDVFTAASADAALKALLSRIVEDTLRTAVDNLLETPNQFADSSVLLQYLTRFDQIHTEFYNFVKRLTSSDLPIREADIVTLIESSIFSDKKNSYVDFEVQCLEGRYRTLIDDDRSARAIVVKAAQAEQKSKKAFLGTTSVAVTANSVDLKMSLPPSLKLDLVVTLIHDNQEAIFRCRKLSLTSKLANNVSKIFRVLVSSISEYLRYGFKDCIAMINTTASNSANPPKMVILEIIQLANSILQNLQRHYEQYVLQSISSSLTARLECVKSKDDIYTSLEDMVLYGLEHMLKAINDHTKYILESEQKKTDYRPNTFQDSNPTPACSRCVEFLNSSRKYIDASLFGKNKESFVIALGVNFYKTLTAHLKNQTINTDGAIRVMRDMDMYCSCMERFQVPVIKERFKTLRQIANLFLVGTENLQNILKDFEGSPIVTREELFQYVKLRADFKSAKLIKHFTDIKE